MGGTPAKKNSAKGILMLLLTSLIWGTGFIAQSVGMESLEAFTFNGIRNLLGALALLPVIALRLMLLKKRSSADAAKKELASAVRHGTILGVVCCVAANFQQFAFYDSTAGKIAFLTALYVLFVPLIGMLCGRKVPPLMWPCILLGFASLYFLCIKPGETFDINRGDILAFVCAFCFAVHILLIERFTKTSDGVILSCTQFLVSGVISLVLMAVFESPSLPAIREASGALLYAGLFSSGIAYTFQILGQKYTDAVIASLLLCMESVFAVIAAFLVLDERMTLREGAGCLMLFTAVVAANLVEARYASKVPLTESPAGADASDAQKTPPEAHPL